MKIRLAILEMDTGYLGRFVSVFSTKYSDKFEIYSFTDKNVAFRSLTASRIDVFVSSEAFDIDVTAIPKRCGFAYFVDSPDVELLKNQPTICRFQRAEQIYKQLLSIYSEHAGNYTELKLTDDTCRLFAFTSPSGGVGNSTMAAAAAIHFTANGHKSVYLNLECFGSSDDYFSGEGQFSMSDVIYALKSKKANLAMKLESCVKQSKQGVFFYSPSKYALDMMELTTEDILRLISELKLTGGYKYIILDIPFDLSERTLTVLRQANAIVMTGDGTSASNTKLARAYAALATKEQSEESQLIGRTVLLYNKFSSKTGAALASGELRVIGGAPKYEQATTSQIVEKLSHMAFFDEIDK